jgi:hypothetical protein
MISWTSTICGGSTLLRIRLATMLRTMVEVKTDSQ